MLVISLVLQGRRGDGFGVVLSEFALSVECFVLIRSGRFPISWFLPEDAFSYGLGTELVADVLTVMLRVTCCVVVDSCG